MIDKAEPAGILMERVRTGEDELDRRFPELQASLLRICTSLVGGAEAEDIVHDTYLRARSTIAQLRDYGAMESWLYRIAVNLCYQRHRRWGRFSRTPLPDEPAAAPRGDLALRDLIERLPRRERVILVLHYGHGYQLNEIADLLSIKHATVRSIVARTRQVLYRQLTEADR